MSLTLISCCQSANAVYVADFPATVVTAMFVVSDCHQMYREIFLQLRQIKVPVYNLINIFKNQINCSLSSDLTFMLVNIHIS